MFRCQSQLFLNMKLSKEENSAFWYLAELREVVLLAEGTLPQSCGIVADGLVVALSLRPPVSNTSYYTGDQLTWKKRRPTWVIPACGAAFLLSPGTSQAECWQLGINYKPLVFGKLWFKRQICANMCSVSYRYKRSLGSPWWAGWRPPQCWGLCRQLSGLCTCSSALHEYHIE